MKIITSARKTTIIYAPQSLTYQNTDDLEAVSIRYNINFNLDKNFSYSTCDCEDISSKK